MLPEQLFGRCLLFAPDREASLALDPWYCGLATSQALLRNQVVRLRLMDGQIDSRPLTYQGAAKEIPSSMVVALFRGRLQFN